jgi:hypothetical protein
MRYSEILLEATEEVWALIWTAYDDLVHRITTDPNAVLVESEYWERRLLSMKGEDAEEQDQINTGIASFGELIEQAERLIQQRDGQVLRNRWEDDDETGSLFTWAAKGLQGSYEDVVEQLIHRGTASP